MKRFSVKVCGLTRPKDAALSTGLGADMIGMIFYRKSPRWVSQQQALKIVSAVSPTVSRVGVFVNRDIEGVLKVARRLRLDYVQLHSGFSNNDIKFVQREGFKVIEAFHIRARTDYESAMSSKADLILLDNATAAVPGGTGQCFDWSHKPPRRIPNLVLAGGIDVHNVEQGINRFAPLVVDVNSGVESSPGIKSDSKLRRFFTLCNRLRYGRQE
ncbi:MAG: phosphoribosylanthranilate isomerase [candidate division Zixibacteria bacterium]|nr:phosphoribosylanthranilate isomerase [candidate division Zixibacteria bacterium]